jgi:hypothetical protein
MQVTRGDRREHIANLKMTGSIERGIAVLQERRAVEMVPADIGRLKIIFTIFVDAMQPS